MKLNPSINQSMKSVFVYPSLQIFYMN